MTSNRISPALRQNVIRTNSKWFRLPALGLVLLVGLASILATNTPGGSDANEVFGKTAWLVDTGEPICSSPAIATDGTVYVTSAGALHAYNADGSLKWRHERHAGSFTSSCMTPVIANDGTIYYENNAFEFTAVNPDGSTEWDYAIPITGRSSDAAALGADGTIYVTVSLSPTLLAINPEGEHLWRLDIGTNPLTRPAIGRDGTVYVGSGISNYQNDPVNVYAINPDGYVEWSYESGRDSAGPPIIGCDGTIYFSDINNLNALEPDGTLKWSFPMTVRGYRANAKPPVIGRDGIIFIGFQKDMGTGSVTDGLFAINPDGSERWYSNFGITAASPAIGSSNTKYVPSASGRLYAIDTSGGIDWFYNVSNSGFLRSSPAIGRHLYIGTSDGFLHAIYVLDQGHAATAWPAYQHDSRRTGNLFGDKIPLDLTVTEGSEEVTIDWDDIAGATYNLYWSTSPGVATSNDKIEDISASEFTHTGLANGTTYYYAVTSNQVCGESGLSEEVSATPQASGLPPEQPSNVVAEAGDGEVSVSWDSVPGATSYNIYWDTSPDVTTTSNGSSINVTSPFVHDGLANGATYYYVVTAVNSYGEGLTSSEVDATPQAFGSPPLSPDNVSAAAGDAEVAVSWDPSVDATSYNIYWSIVSPVTEAVYDGVFSDVTSPHDHPSLTNGTTYYYVVTAINGYGESAISAEVSATPEAAVVAPSSPASIDALAGNGEITVSWTPSADATSYNLYWATTPGVTISAGTPLPGVTSPFIHTGRTNGLTHYYVVTAVNSAGESAVSSEASATPLASRASTYGGGLKDIPNSVQALPGGGYIVSGETRSFGAGNNDAWVLKINVDGSIDWQKTYGSALDDRGREALQTKDGGFVVGGFNSGADAWILKLNADGTSAWQKAYDNTVTSFINAIRQTADDGYVAGGWVDLLAMGSKEFQLLKVADTGAVEWQKVYTDTSTIVDVQQTSDGGYVAIGNASTAATASIDVWILKVDSDGSVQWLKTYGTTSYDYGFTIEQTSDAGYVVAGLMRGGAGEDDGWILKLNETGGVIWQKAYGGTQNEIFYDIQQIAGGGYIVAGSTESFGAGGGDAWLLKLDATGVVVWEKAYGGSGIEGAAAVDATADGGYVVAAYTNSFGAGGIDVLLLKVDSDGTLGCGLDADSTATITITTAAGSDATTTEESATPIVIDTGLVGVDSSATFTSQCP